LEALFIIAFVSRGGSRFNRENSADHDHYTHDSISEATISRLHDARHFWRPGHETFSGFIKARERPQKGGRTEGGRKQKKTQGRNRGQSKKNRAEIQSKKAQIHIEKERKGRSNT
jgi:hypothetical protein